ncbi:hypothetical protein THF1C08_320092 [Vibrio jasicida]|uniref:Transposase n=1 Tax=Vibrio jasicida TaxID=766224 RepID=A0AAU9QSV7_9VIBR|nr:hypothetical protein THF1C08_320092 [Vibrio jasicida]CAH1597537.1 hypothetical protein THF1A12_320092 [Vibrio jasicida]
MGRKRKLLLKKVQRADRLGASESQMYTLRKHHGRKLCLNNLLNT